MKKILMALVMGFFVIGAYGQADILVRSVRFEAQSEAEMNAIPSNKLQEGSVCYREDTDSLWRYDGSAWAEISGGIPDGDKGDITVSGSTWTIDNGVVTEAKLNTSVNTSLDLADSALQNVVEDSTPELGGDMNANNNSITNISALTVNSRINLENELRILPDNVIGSTIDHNSISFKTGNIAYFKKVNESVGLGLDFDALTADRTYELPDASGTIALTSDLGNLGPSNLDLTASYTWTGFNSFTSGLNLSSFLRVGNNLSSTDYSLSRAANLLSFNAETTLSSGIFTQVATLDADGDFTANSFIKSGATSDDILLGDGTTTSLAGIGGGTDDQTLSLGGTGNKDLTILDGNTVDLTGVTGIDPNNVIGTISGRTGTTVTGVLQQTQAQLTADGEPSSGEIVFCSDCDPAETVTATTLDVDNYKAYDDRATDAATFTFSNLKVGATVMIEINRATDATYSGVTVAYDEGTFAANTRQLVTIFVLPSGDVWRKYKTIE